MSAGQTAASFAPDSIGGGATSTYSAQVLADSPLLYWRLGEASGSTATDSSGNSRHGTYSGSPTFNVPSLIAAETDTAVYFNNATNDYISLASNAWMNTTSVTVTCVSAVRMGGGISMLMSRYHDPSGDRSWFLYSDNAVFKFYARGTDGQETIVNSGFTALQGVAYFISAYSSGAEVGIRVYDATGLVASATGVGRIVNPSNRPFMVARSDDGAAYQHEAYIDEVVFYDSVLTPTRIDALAGLALAPQPKWLNFTSGSIPRSAVYGHTLTFPATAAGSFMVVVTAVTFATNTDYSHGWTKRLSAAWYTELNVFTRTANAGETTFDITYDTNNRAMNYAIYEFPAGTRWHSGLTNITSTQPVLSGLPATPVTAFGAIAAARINPDDLSTYTNWRLPYFEDYDVMSDIPGGEGIYLTVGHRDFLMSGNTSTMDYSLYDVGLSSQHATFALIVA